MDRTASATLRLPKTYSTCFDIHRVFLAAYERETLDTVNEFIESDMIPKMVSSAEEHKTCRAFPLSSLDNPEGEPYSSHLDLIRTLLHHRGFLTDTSDSGVKFLLVYW